MPRRTFHCRQASEQRLAKIGVEWWPLRLYNDESAVAILADIAFLCRIERDKRLLSTHPVAQHRQQSERILLNECLDLRRGHRQEITCMRDLSVKPGRPKTFQRLRRTVGS